MANSLLENPYGKLSEYNFSSLSRRTKNSPETKGKSENVVVFFVLYSYTSFFDISFPSLFQFAQTLNRPVSVSKRYYNNL